MSELYHYRCSRCHKLWEVGSPYCEGDAHYPCPEGDGFWLMITAAEYTRHSVYHHIDQLARAESSEIVESIHYLLNTLDAKARHEDIVAIYARLRMILEKYLHDQEPDRT